MDDVKKELHDLKIKFKRIEEFLGCFPNSEDYLTVDSEEDIREVEKLVTKYDSASASFLQRKMSIGYSRAARLLDILEKRGVVGPAEGSQPRKVLNSKETREA